MNSNIVWTNLIFFILLCQASGILGAVFTRNSVRTWYKSLKKPFFNPPSWLFGPVWTFLYTLMGISGYLLWQSQRSSSAMVLFFIQLILNAIWTPLFFGAKQLGWALIEIALMWLAITVTIILSWNTNMAAGVLLIPYLAWVSFASVLNFSLWNLNKTINK